MALDLVNLRVNGRNLQLLYQALDELPGKVGRPLFNDLVAQVEQQLEADAAAEQKARDEAAAGLREQHRAELKQELDAAAKTSEEQA